MNEEEEYTSIILNLKARSKAGDCPMCGRKLKFFFGYLKEGRIRAEYNCNCGYGNGTWIPSIYDNLKTVTIGKDGEIEVHRG